VRGPAVIDSVFAANRAAGRIALSVGAVAGRTRRRRTYEDGPLRARFPNVGRGDLEAIIVNTAGGVAGGDRHDIDVVVGSDARLSMTTAAAEKVYRSLGSPAEIAIKLAVGAGGHLTWLPHETIMFDGAQLQRRVEVDLAAGASLLMAEAVVFGRSAMGEVVASGSFADRWRVRRDGVLMFAEAACIDGAPVQRLALPAVAAGGVAIATALAIPGDEAMVERVRAQSFAGEIGASAWNGLAVARFCARDGAALRRDLTKVIAAFGGAPPRIWLS
jgi:urease accessory protein